MSILDNDEPYHKCRKLKSIPDSQFQELINLGAKPVRPDSEIDIDCRVIEYEDFLKTKGFEYRNTRLSSTGGVRSYDNKSVDKTVEVMRSSDTKDIQYWIGKISNRKEIAHGKKLDDLKRRFK